MPGDAVWWARFRAVHTFEVRAQWREPLTTLYGLVFGLLALGYASSDAVELVSNRGDVPRTSSWALMLAFGGLTAFGQVITTMIATTAMLRDEAQRTRALVATSGLGPRTWFAARVSAALVVMLIVYAAMPLGVLAGTAISGGDVGAALRESTRAYAFITLPTMVTVTLVLSCAALVTQRVLGVLAAALALVAVWQVALSLAANPQTAIIGAWLDPFGNAPVLVETAHWRATQKAHSLVPLGGHVLRNRVLWLMLALVGTALVQHLAMARAFAPLPPSAHHRGDVATAKALAAADSPLTSVRRFTSSWMQFDGGWRVVTVLAVLNALFNAVTRALPPEALPPERFAAALMLVSEHSRLFLILLATVYAGELVWRERDVRVQPLMDTMPVSARTVAWGRLQGLLVAQRAVVLPLSLVALVVALVRGSGGQLSNVELWIAWSAFVLWLPFAQLTLLSLAVHVLLDHKVLAHLLLITGWVLAVVLNGRGVDTWWVRFAEPAPVLQQGAVAWADLATRGVYWSVVGLVLLFAAWYVRNKNGGNRLAAPPSSSSGTVTSPR